MITVFILSYLTLGGFGTAHMVDAAACDRALADLSPEITWDGECTQIEIFVVGSILAPEFAPPPPPKPTTKDSRTA